MLTLEQKATNHETWTHINKVQKNIMFVVKELLDRAVKHDQSKLQTPEVEKFTEYTAKLSETTYGSTEYEEYRKKLGDAIVHHYAKNDHHPEHHELGIEDMDLVQLMEMFCDWKASSKRHNDGNILKSIKINGNRFSMSPQLIKIFENTAKLMDNV